AGRTRRATGARPLRDEAPELPSGSHRAVGVLPTPSASETTARGLFPAPGSGTLRRAEGYAGAHGLLLHGRGGAAELLRDLTGRRARTGERLQGRQLTHTP